MKIHSLSIAYLQKFKKFGKCESALLEDVRERAFRNFGVHGYYRLPGLVADPFFERNMTTLLPELHKPSSL
jgi:hypothetical protein